MEENFNEEFNTQQPIPSKNTYKMITLRGKVVFPGQVIHFDFVRERSLSAILDVLNEGLEVFLVNQKRASTVTPAPQDIYRVGTLAKIKQVQRLPGGGKRVLFSAQRRMKIDSYVAIKPYFEVVLKDFPYAPNPDPIYFEALSRQLEEHFTAFRKFDTKMPGDVMSSANVSEPESFVCDLARYVVPNEVEQQNLLEMETVCEQYDYLNELLAKEIEIRTVEKRISTKVRENIDKSQREYYLHEQIKAIKDELGEDVDEVELYKQKAEELKLSVPEFVYEKAVKEISRFEKMNPSSPDANVSRTYLELLLEMPWTSSSEDNIDLKAARKILDTDHYGMDKVKERIIEYLAVYKLTGNFKSPILCFVGAPGVGKTSIVKSIARAMGRKLATMSLGGVRDEAEIRGHRRTYVAALPGRIISSIRQVNVNNPVFLLDEIDKTSSDFRGDPASALLEVLDPNQNNAFKDNFLEVPFDLSKTMFVTTANTLDTIPAPLLDRMEVIELSGYTQEEKLQIAKRYLKPKQIEANGLSDYKVEIPDASITAIISQYTRESGVRNLERCIATVARKIAVQIADGSNTSFKILKKDLPAYLGAPKYKDVTVDTNDEVGLATGLAWTAVGGVTLPIEVALISGGKGEIKLTGSLGDVMKESCMTALTLVRVRADEYGIDRKMFTDYDIHVHFPDGATPKDGPSAGITISTALMSAFSGRKIAHDVAMTGEVTLRGKVFPIGGLKEKSLAAYRAGIKRLIIPEENRKDVFELPDEIKNNIKIIYADNIDTVFANALVK